MRGWTRRWIGRLDGLGHDSPRGGDLVERLLSARGLHDKAERQAFQEPGLDGLHHPSTLPGAQAAAVHLLESVRAERSIAIYGDYDVDGIMAAAILYHVLILAAPDSPPRLYVPHRIEEGYGLNVPAIEQLAAEGVDLVVSVDCGVTAFDVCSRAQELGLELIITDHHAFARADDGSIRLPEPDLLVHPAHPEGPAPFTELCGAGVALKLAWLFLMRWFGSNRLPKIGESLLRDLFAFAALATIADVVPLVGENRIIASYGLRKRLSTDNGERCAAVQNEGLLELLAACGFDKPNYALTASDVAFRIAPVLNSAGRLGSADDALALVTTASPSEARKISKDLKNKNRQRQEECREITRNAAELVETRGFLEPDRRGIVLAERSWSPGLVGICCSRLVEQFGRPVILLQEGDETCRGSARSVAGFSVHAALTECARVLNRGEEVLVFGGHDAAAGLTIPTDRLPEFVELFVGCANEALDTEQLLASIEIDGVADLDEFNLRTLKEIEGMGPFGAGNPYPRLVLEGVEVGSTVRMGNSGQHLQTRVLATGCPGIKAIWWRAPDVLEELLEVKRLDRRVDLVVEPRVDRWGGREEVLLEVVDARICENVPLAGT